jgi:amino acid transporter
MSSQKSVKSAPLPQSGGRFGFFGGVFTPSVLTILGVIMYLRLGWAVGTVGLAWMLVIIVLAHLISIATGLSISSIATNRMVKTGGAYYMISRSLGAPAGAAIGIPLFFAQAISVTFYIVGFTESLAILWPNINQTAVGMGVLILLTLISLKSADLAIRTQYVIMTVIVLSLVSFFVGTGDPAPKEFVWTGTQNSAGFALVFAVFFPAVTGIMAGVSMSGDLKDPRSAIPRGTMLAIIVGFVVYLIMPIWLVMNATPTQLTKDNTIVWKIARWDALIYAGVWGATLSSAVGSILSAPRTLQALGIDGLAPKIFAKGYGPTNEPRAGVLLTFGLAAVGIMLGSLDLIAPILTMFFLATYGVTNLACGLENWAKSPSFRPTFQIPTWVSMGGAFACFYVMSVINLPAMLVALLICAAIFVYAERRVLSTTWGDARHGIWAALLRASLLQLHRADYHPMNWRPNLLILGGNPKKRSYLLESGSTLAQEYGIVSYFHLLTGSVSEFAQRRQDLAATLEGHLADTYPNLFYRVEIVDDLYKGAVSVAQSYGVGRFEANTVMLGWPNSEENIDEFVQMLRDLRSLERSLLLVNYDEKRGFGQYNQIHVWWGGLRGNGGLILLLAFLLRGDVRWRNAEVTLYTVIEKEEAREGVEKNLQAVVEQARLRAEVKVIVRNGHPISSIMHGASSEADLTILGLRLPSNDQSSVEFYNRYNEFVNSLPTTLLVCSARNFEGEPVLFDD